MNEWTHTVTGGPWPERIGLRCRIVTPLRDEYPWDKRSTKEVVVLIENDPLGDDWPLDWSCCLLRTHLTPLESS